MDTASKAEVASDGRSTSTARCRCPCRLLVGIAERSSAYARRHRTKLSTTLYGSFLFSASIEAIRQYHEYSTLPALPKPPEDDSTTGVKESCSTYLKDALLIPLPLLLLRNVAWRDCLVFVGLCGGKRIEDANVEVGALKPKSHHQAQ